MDHMEFRTSPVGVEVTRLFEDPKLIDEMIDLSRKGIPAVQALDEPLWRAFLNGSLRHVERKYLDRRERQGAEAMVEEEMQAEGWKKDWKKLPHVVKGRLFSKGSVYIETIRRQREMSTSATTETMPR